MTERGGYSHIKAIFFDMDGLLVDTELASFASTCDVFASYDVEVTREWYIREHLEKGVHIYEPLRAKGISEEDIQQVRQLRNAAYAKLLEGIKPIDGVVETLEALRGAVSMAIVTMSRRSNFEIIMRNTSLGEFFDFTITCDDVMNVKPNPDAYLKAVELSQKRPADCLALEDSRRGVDAAKAAGITCFAIPDELTRTHDFSIADKILGSIREVPPLLGI